MKNIQKKKFSFKNKYLKNVFKIYNFSEEYPANIDHWKHNLVQYITLKIKIKKNHKFMRQNK